MNFIFFGDSICFGQFISPQKTWVTKVSEKINDKVSNYNIMNVSISGNTTRMALERMAFDVTNHGIEVIYIQFGMNDCNYWKTDKFMPRVSKAAFEANLIEIADRAKMAGAKKLFIGTNHTTPKLSPFEHYSAVSYQNSNAEYNDIIRKVAKSESLILVDNELNWKRAISNGSVLNELLLADEIHLSEKGHAVYADFVSKIILSEL